MVLGRDSLPVYARPCVSAEIPPAGAPPGFDFAAMFDCIICFLWFCRSAQDDKEGCLLCGVYNFSQLK